MLTIKITRSDLLSYCKNISISNLTSREIDPQKISKKDYYKANLVYFEDGEDKKVLKNKNNHDGRTRS